MRTIQVYNNLKPDDCGLWYSVLIFDKKIQRWSKCVCLYDKCSSFKEAIDYYFKTFHQNHYEIHGVSHYKVTALYLSQLAMAC
jgi:hypothetical protein